MWEQSPLPSPVYHLSSFLVRLLWDCSETEFLIRRFCELILRHCADAHENNLLHCSHKGAGLVKIPPTLAELSLFSSGSVEGTTVTSIQTWLRFFSQLEALNLLIKALRPNLEQFGCGA